jgi:hypothetical protein
MTLDNEQKEAITTRAVLVVADRVDALIHSPSFDDLAPKQAMTCLKKNIKAALSEIDHLYYDIVSRGKRNKLLVNVKMFSGEEVDYDIQMVYSLHKKG